MELGQLYGGTGLHWPGTDQSIGAVIGCTVASPLTARQNFVADERLSPG